MDEHTLACFGGAVKWLTAEHLGVKNVAVACGTGREIERCDVYRNVQRIAITLSGWIILHSETKDGKHRHLTYLSPACQVQLGGEVAGDAV